ncbi:MAG: hypothetical protein L0Z68_09080 [Gammaproteobacteria bacterium]|nr:hypothetical protein [Gammaproteobacteria bacterium]
MNTTTIQTTPGLRSSQYPERRLFGYAAIIGIALLSFQAQAATIEFNDPFPAPHTFVPHPGLGSDVFYSEDGMSFIAVNQPHYHLFAENNSFPVPADAPKFLHPHADGDIVRMIYDPDKDGVPNRFDLLDLEVKPGAAFTVHAEVDYSGVNGAVYGPLGEGYWTTTDGYATGLLFVDFWVCPGCTNGGIDNIGFEPASGTGLTATCNGMRATIVGTPGDDALHGTWLPDIIHVGDGNDTITSYSGNDVICGGNGNDTINSSVAFSKNVTKAGVDDDVVSGGPGNDEITSGDGDDKLDGGKGTDTCDGGRHINGDTAKSCETKSNIP